MSLFDGLRHRLYVLRRGEDYAREVQRELRFHLDLHTLATQNGDTERVGPELEARRAFGNVGYYREEVRRMSALNWLDGVRQDLGYAWRGLRRSPGFTLAIVVTLGLGLGVNAAVFSFLDRLFAQPPAGVTRPEEVRRLYIDASDSRSVGERIAYDSFRYPYFTAISAAVGSSVELAAFTVPDSAAVIAGDVRIPLRRSRVTGAYFHLLGATPERGRFFVNEETRIETPTPVAVISDAFWRRVYQADEKVLGKTIEINARPYTIIGVAAAPFRGVDINAADVWLPANTYGSGRGPRGEPWYESFHSSFAILARASTGVPDARITTAATTALRSVHLAGWRYDSTQAVVTGPIIRAVGPASRSQELTISTRLAGVALMVLLIACANVANLLLVRATRRRREIALRRALGVSTARLSRQLISESLLLALLGGGVGLLFALWGGSALRHLLLPHVQWAGPAVDHRVVFFVIAASLFTGLLAGFAPALHATRPGLIDSLKAGSREGAYQRSRARTALLVVQTALSVVLLAGAGLFIRSLQNVRDLDLGFDIYHTLTMGPSFLTNPPPPTEVASRLAAVTERLRTTNGVEGAALATATPMGGYAVSRIFLPGHDSLPMFGNERGASMVGVSPGYFRAAGVAFLSGRDFNASDSRTSASVLIVSRAMAGLYWPGENPIGKCLKIGKQDAPCSTVVGVVADVHRMQLIEDPTLQYYRPISQLDGRAPSVILVRTSERNMGAVARVAGEELRRAFPRATPPIITTVAHDLDPQLRPWRLGAQIFTALGILALLVAGLGVYSVVAYAVSQRTHELGVRIALGARAPDVVSLVLGEGSRVVLTGVIVGVGLSLAGGRLISSLLFGVSARDPFVLAGTALALVIVGIAASTVPGWRATKVDPVAALRTD